MGSLEEAEVLLECFIDVERFENNGKVHNGKIYNNFMIFEDEVVVQLNGDKYMLCNLDDWNKLKKYTWHWNKGNGYAYTVVYGGNEGKSIDKFTFHQKVTGKNNADHINRNRLDNRRLNLRVIDDEAEQKAIQGRNKCIMKNNTSGEKNIKYRADRDAWEVEINIKHKGVRIKRNFSINKFGDEAFEMAKKARDELIAQYYN
jgi:hypothetical protein